MAVTISTGYTFVSGEVVTPTKLNAAGVPSLTAGANEVLGTTTAGAVTTITCTSAGRDILDDADASAQRATLGLGTLATQAANAVSISGGTIAGVTSLTVANSTAAGLSRVSINRGTVALSDGTNIGTDCSLGNVFTVTLGGNRTLTNPTNQAAGASYAWIITQDGAGSRTLAYGSAFKFSGGTDPTASTGAGDVDIITGMSDGTSVYCAMTKDFS